MSSNIRIQRVCQFCKQTFVAKTFSTKYCSHNCNSKDYKRKLKEERISAVNKEVKIEKTIKKSSKAEFSVELLNQKPYLNIAEVCILLNISDSTIRKYLKNGLIPSLRIGKKHIVKKVDLESILKLTI
ncbi:helix-turn-helix domain-containing protein [Flavobacterium sp.]|uniref:helix-turn-helix domain-containing protein n=1 Tax=Flavobacterium sp. TaxID=239 RepID=UPI0025F3411A|nr:helix-turn-helix domain-containing protein [Flavobacterium sp.]